MIVGVVFVVVWLVTEGRVGAVRSTWKLLEALAPAEVETRAVTQPSARPLVGNALPEETVAVERSSVQAPVVAFTALEYV